MNPRVNPEGGATHAVDVGGRDGEVVGASEQDPAVDQDELEVHLDIIIVSKSIIVMALRAGKEVCFRLRTQLTLADEKVEL